MSEDRTQPASKRRRQQAREQGQAAHSPELTAAAGWLFAMVVLAFMGGPLVSALLEILRDALSAPMAPTADVAGVVARARGVAWGLAWPLATVISAFAIGAFAAHQAQVRGLWAVGLIAPDPARLWALGRGEGPAVRLGNTAWSAFRALVLVAVSAWMVRSLWIETARLGELTMPALASAAGWLMLQLAGALAGVSIVLGLCDFGIRHARFEAHLRMTPHEHREEQKVMEGDAAARSQRRRIARSWRDGPTELVTGASLVLNGRDGLTVVLSGGPPPRRITVRAAANGEAGHRLRLAARAAKVSRVEADGLARRLARRARPGSTTVTGAAAAELAAIWPGRAATVHEIIT